MLKQTRFWAALVVAFVLTLFAAVGTIDTANCYLSDLLYQHSSPVSGKIVIIGIDEKSLEIYGPYQKWGREKIAKILNTLNASDECHPTLIGLDILYSGETELEEDQALTDAAGRYNNVVTASAASFDTTFIESDQKFILNNFYVTEYEEPFQNLKNVTTQGHINAMMDTDGVLRHHMLYLDLPTGERIPSLALELAERYRGNIKLPPVDRFGFWYLPYSNIPGKYEIRSAADILNGNDPPSYFKDKIVLIGPYSSGLQDSYITSIDHAQQMYGVEYQANALEALLAENYKQEINQTVQLVITFFILFASYNLFWKQKVQLSTIIWFVICCGWIILCKFIYENGWILYVLYIPVGVTILYVGCLAANYIQASLERQKVTQTFRRYVAPEIVSELLNLKTNDLQLGGKLTDIAVLFVDIRGFTSMSEILEPSQVVEILNQYLTLTTNCIMNNHGTLDKFVGDCTMALWNTPLPQENYCLLACQAAMEMVNSAKSLSDKLLHEYGHTVSFGIGIHTGPAVVGNIGAPMRMDYTAIGDTVNIAARLESNAPGGKIYISRAVADALEGQIKATSIDRITLKGKKEPFEVLTLDAILSEEEL